MADLQQQSGNVGEESGLGPTREQAAALGNLLDPDGVPRDRPISDWLDLFGMDGPIDARAGRWLQAILRYSRADGSPVFGPRGRSPSRLRRLRALSERSGDPGLLAAVSRWLPARSDSVSAVSPPPLACDWRRDRVLCVLRPDWSPKGDLMAVDHRRSGDETLLELAARGQTWLGPSWTSGQVVGKITPARPTHWTSGGFADCSEWAYQVGSRRITRSVVLLRGRSMALLSQQDEGGVGTSEIRFELGDGIEATPMVGSRSILLSAGRGRPTARFIPLGLPDHDRTTDLGSIAIEGRNLVIRQVGEGRRRWLPALICWGKAPVSWRASTVAYRSKACRGDVAAAVRVAWGVRDEGLVVYRSLGSTALRSFLGHQTGARYLVGAFTRSGDVRPILKVDS